MYSSIMQLAKGGMGRVDIAIRREEGFERLYAVKRLHEQHRDDNDFVRMFLEEARLGGLIRHANVVSVLDVGTDDDGPFLVMDYVDGRSVSHVITQAAEQGAMIPVQLCVRIVKQAAAGLHAAHELRDTNGRSLELVHRDVSPQNILVGFDGIVRLTDFGIAKVYDASTRTTTGVLKGKGSYMSPEQFRFDVVDRRSDLFALGVVLYELLASGRLYPTSRGQAMHAILHEPVPDVGQVRGDVPPELSALLFRLLAKSPSARPDTARDVQRELDKILAGLIADEGSLELAEYMEEEHATERNELSLRVHESLERISQLAPDEVDVEVQTTQVKAERRGLRRWVVVLGAVAIVAVVLGIWQAVTPRDDEPPSSAEPAGRGAAPDNMVGRTSLAVPATSAGEAGSETVAASAVLDDVDGPDGANREGLTSDTASADRQEPVRKASRRSGRSRRARERARATREVAAMRVHDPWPWM